MKRAMLGALAVAAGLFLAAPAVNANHLGAPQAPPPAAGCTLVNDLAPPNGWPRDGHYYYCGTNVALYKLPTASAFGTMNSTLKGVLRNNNTWLAIFDTKAEAATYLGALPANIDGITRRLSWAGGPIFVFSASWETIPSADMEEVIIHEQGHAFDYAYGSTIGEPKGVSQKPSAVFWTKVAADFVDINALSRAVVFPRGVPNQKIDKPGGTWTAYNPGTKTNEQILKDLYPWLFDGSEAANGELFAHLYVKFRNKFLNDCPYAAVPQGGGVFTNYLTWPETFTHFKKTSQTNSTSYFGVMWNNTAAFVP